jgi:hypothetical protein
MFVYLADQTELHQLPDKKLFNNVIKQSKALIVCVAFWSRMYIDLGPVDSWYPPLVILVLSKCWQPYVTSPPSSMVFGVACVSFDRNIQYVSYMDCCSGCHCVDHLNYPLGGQKNAALIFMIL